MASQSKLGEALYQSETDQAEATDDESGDGEDIVDAEVVDDGSEEKK